MLHSGEFITNCAVATEAEWLPLFNVYMDALDSTTAIKLLKMFRLLLKLNVYHWLTLICGRLCLRLQQCSQLEKTYHYDLGLDMQHGQV